MPALIYRVQGSTIDEIDDGNSNITNLRRVAGGQGARRSIIVIDSIGFNCARRAFPAFWWYSFSPLPGT
jgi:hypothetical protein